MGYNYSTVPWIIFSDKRAAAEMNMGIVLVMKKRYEEALQHYVRALEDRPFYPVCYYNMGNAVSICPTFHHLIRIIFDPLSVLGASSNGHGPEAL